MISAGDVPFLNISKISNSKASFSECKSANRCQSSGHAKKTESWMFVIQFYLLELFWTVFICLFYILRNSQLESDFLP